MLAPSATLGFDINDVNVAPAPGFAGRSQGLHLGVYLAPSVTVTWRVTARVGIFADLAAALYVRRLRYVVADPGGQQVALAPWTAQPLARIGLVISIF